MDLNDSLRLRRHLRIVGYDNDRMPLIAKLVQDRHHLFAGMAVERAGWLIREDHLPTVHQGTGNTHALLLAAGQLRGLILHPLRQPQARQQHLRALEAFFPLDARIDRRNFHVLRGIEVRKQMVTLEDKAEVLPTQLRQRVAVQR